jgi:hypothetical protein
VNISTIWRLYAAGLLGLLVLLGASIVVAVWLVLS